MASAGPVTGTNAVHERLRADLLAVGAPYSLVLAGGDAVRAHGLVDRFSRGVDMATEHPAAMAEIVDGVRAGLEERGWVVGGAGEIDPLAARLLVRDPASGEECYVDLRKEVLWRPPVMTQAGPTLSLEDLIGTKVRALADRGLPRDLIDVHAAADRWSRPELEELGRRHAPDTFDLAELQSRLTGTDWLDDTEFRAHGLDWPAVERLRRWAQEWADDIAERLVEGEDPQDDEEWRGNEETEETGGSGEIGGTGETGGTRETGKTERTERTEGTGGTETQGN